jgi:hypothetical protein
MPVSEQERESSTDHPASLEMQKLWKAVFGHDRHSVCQSEIAIPEDTESCEFFQQRA